MNKQVNKLKIGLKAAIREVIREELRHVVKSVIKEIKGPIENDTDKMRKLIKKSPKLENSEFSKNKVLNQVLNETAMDEEWNTLGDGKYDSSKMNEIMSREYSGLGGGNVNIPQNAESRIREMGAQPEAVPEKVVDNIFNKDYGALMKAIDKKQGK